MDDDFKEESTESDDDLSEDLGDDPADGSSSDVETSDIIFEQTIHVADPNLSQLQFSACLGKPFLSANYFSLLWI